MEDRDLSPYLLDKQHRGLFPQIWALGDLSILQKPLLAFFCSVKCPGELILRTYDLARAFRDSDVPVISGFHSPIEKDCLDLLIRGTQPIVICPARGIENMRLGKELKANIEKGRVFESAYNRAIIEKGAIPISPEKLSQWAFSLANGNHGRVGV